MDGTFDQLEAPLEPDFDQLMIETELARLENRARKLLLRQNLH